MKIWNFLQCITLNTFLQNIYFTGIYLRWHLTQLYLLATSWRHKTEQKYVHFLLGILLNCFFQLESY